MYRDRPQAPASITTMFAPLQRVFEAKWGFDLAYDWFVRRVVVQGSETVLWKVVDAGLIDGAVNGVGLVTRSVADASRAVQSGLVRGYVLLILGGSVIVLSYLLWMTR
jgi:NADH-quinone oxidoreductase subunit L